MKRREIEMFGLDFVIVATRHADNCSCGEANVRQVVAYPAQATRLVRLEDGSAQVVIDFDPDQDHKLVESGNYRQALIALVADENWAPPGDAITADG